MTRFGVSQRFGRTIAGVMMGTAAAVLLGACDEIGRRVDDLGKLADCSAKQVSGAQDPNCAAAPGPDTALAEAPIEARALFGVQTAPLDDAPVSIDDRLHTESFFAVGSVIAKPKEEIQEPAVETATFDLAAANAPMTAEDAETPAPPASAEPAPIAPAPPPPPTVPGAAAGGAGVVPGAPAPNRDLKVRSLPRIATQVPTRTMREVLAPTSGSLEKAVRQSGVKVDQTQVMEARRYAERAIKADSETAQSVGDDLARKARDMKAPVPRELAVRAKLNVDRAVAVRDRTFNRLEKLGLSGIVTPEEGGVMRINIGVSPTKLGDKIDLTKIQQMRAIFASTTEEASKKCPENPDIEKLKADPVLATECVVEELKKSGEFEYVEKDYIFTHQMLKKPASTTPKPGGTVAPAGVRPNDPLFGLQWGFLNNGAAAGQSAGGAGFSDFWTRAKVTGSRNVVVAVVDTGLQMSHPDIKASANIAAGYDMVSDPVMGNDGDGPDADPNDPGDKCDLSDPSVTDTFHGTHVAGTIGAGLTNNGAGISGGAWNVTLVPVRALGRCGGKLSDINAGIRWAAGVAPARDSKGNEVWNQHPADIINLSIGLFEPCPASMQAAINDAVAAGATVVAAAGNARIDTKYYAPGGCQNVISVAAGDARGQLTPYSNFGSNVMLLAPGGDMSRDDDKDGRPDGILSTKFSKNCYDPVTGKSVAECYYAYENGTSMAAPHVTAALALLQAKFPQAVPSELRTRLMTATSTRSTLQCSGKCSSYPGTTPIPGSDGMCSRPCGGVMLNLANAKLQ